MQCQKFVGYNSELIAVYKPKRAYNTLDEAILVEKKHNSHDNIFQKVVAYKCSECHKYHVGRNGKEIKYKEKWQ